MGIDLSRRRLINAAIVAPLASLFNCTPDSLHASKEKTMTDPKNRNMNSRGILTTFDGSPTTDGAGVRLTRYIGHTPLNYIDPFLLFDEFKSHTPDDYMAGFPMHPHRGIETVTYMIEGRMEHQDSLGNRGIIGPGDIQWMTAGSGIIHSEMPAMENGKMWGFQLWVNLPAKHKMTHPNYREIKSQYIPVVSKDGKEVRIIAGTYKGVAGPVDEIATKPLYLDVSMTPNSHFDLSVSRDFSAFAVVLSGQGHIGKEGSITRESQLIQFGPGNGISITTQGHPMRFLLIGGKPLNQPVARGGPFVMNTQDEIQLAYREYQEGTFIKTKPKTTVQGY